MLLYLIRHGQSIANVKKLVTGDHNDVLSEDGINEVNELKLLIKKMRIKGDRYITSQWIRAQQTAKILWPDVEWKIDKRVGETEAGKVSNMQLEEFLLENKDFYKNNNNIYPSGESHFDLNQRVNQWLIDITNNVMKNSDVVLVAHAGPISCILQSIERINMDMFPAYKAANASLSIVDIPNNNLKDARLISFSLLKSSKDIK